MPLLTPDFLPAQLRQLSLDVLPSLAQEVRCAIINALAAQGGHLGASLGVVELTIALHYVYNTPTDALIWDVGHQTYAHKALTGRLSQLHTLRQEHGLSGFTMRAESMYDAFGAAHSSTSLSAALGMARARDTLPQHYNVACVIGDGALSAGMAYEALNNIGELQSPMVIVLNDNNLSISPPTGALAQHLNALRMGTARASDNFFTHLGLHYLPPVDGHNIAALIEALQHASALNKPVVLHVVTKKGKGYALTEHMPDGGHAVAPYDAATGQPLPKNASSDGVTYTKAFANALIAHAKQDSRIVAVTAAMPTGTGLQAFAQQFADRFYDVGIAEQHAVTFAAGMACMGLKPFVAIYSTFLQRAYDQVVHDVALQNLPVRFMLDRAGLVGADGPTHAGVYDTAYLSCLPNMVLMAPANEAELTHAVAVAVGCDDSPCAVRYPRGEGAATDTAPAWHKGRGYIVHAGQDVAILSYGTRLQAARDAGQLLAQEYGLHITIADARFAKPLDEALIIDLATTHRHLFLLEDSIGFAPLVLSVLSKHRITCNTHILALPDAFVPHATQQAQYAHLGLDGHGIARGIASRALSR